MTPTTAPVAGTVRLRPPAAAAPARGAWTDTDLRAESDAHRGSGGCSEENGELGFRPAFRDDETGAVYRASFRDGNPAPFHLLDGLPDEVVVSRSASGRVTAVKGALVSGFVRGGRFYTRGEAAAALPGATASRSGQPCGSGTKRPAGNGFGSASRGARGTMPRATRLA